MDVTPAGAKVVARSAYIFAYPLVVSYGEMYADAIDRSSPSYAGGFGIWRHERDGTPSESDGVVPLTTLHSSSWVDLRSEPWLARHPGADAGRILTGCTSDLWDFAIDEIAADGSGAGPVMMASPTWVGDVPEDVDRVVRGDSAFVHLESWIQFREPADLDRIGRIEHEFRLVPLSAHVRRPAPAPVPRLNWQPYHDGAETGDDFWSLVNFALSLTAPHPQDREILDRIATIGVVAGQLWDASSISPDVAEAIGDGMDDALSDLMRAAAEPLDPALLHRSRVGTDRDYFHRALGSLWRGPVARSTDERRAG